MAVAEASERLQSLGHPVDKYWYWGYNIIERFYRIYPPDRCNITVQ